MSGDGQHESLAAMKPVCSPSYEFRARGAGQLLIGCAFAAFAIGVQRRGGVVASLLVGAAVYGTLISVYYRRALNQALSAARPTPHMTIEARSRTVQRVGLSLLALASVMIALEVLFRDPAIVGGIMLGNGAAFLALSGRVIRWERAHDAEIFREPNRRWGLAGVGEQRSRGLLDPMDFYLQKLTAEF